MAVKKVGFSAILVLAGIAVLSGCASRKPNAGEYDNLPLEKRSHVDTVRTENRADPFRP